MGDKIESVSRKTFTYNTVKFQEIKKKMKKFLRLKRLEAIFDIYPKIGTKKLEEIFLITEA